MCEPAQNKSYQTKQKEEIKLSEEEEEEEELDSRELGNEEGSATRGATSSRQ